LPTLVFDCETIPNSTAYAVRLNLPETTPLSALETAWLNANLPFKPELQRIVSLAVAWIADDGTLQRLRTLGPDEPDALREFFHAMTLHPVLTGWNTSGFDLPVLLTRALVHHISVGEFYTHGDYLKRYVDRSHRDLMDLQSHYGATARLSLDEMAAVLGIPGKLTTHGNEVSTLYQAGDLATIHAYCQHDVLTTAWVYARIAEHRGWWTSEMRHQFEISAQAWVLQAATTAPHWTPWIDAALARHLWDPTL